MLTLLALEHEESSNPTQHNCGQTTSFVGKLLEQDDVDALREGVRVACPGRDGDRGELPDRRRTLRAQLRTSRLPLRLPHPPLGHPPGTIELKIPKVTAGAYLPVSARAPPARGESLQAVIVEAYVKGVSTRKVDDLVRALGIDGISRSEVSRICKVLDEEVRTFLGRPIETPVPLPLAGRDVPQGP